LNVVLYEDVIANVAVGSNTGFWQDVSECPYAGTGADGWRFHAGVGMDKDV
jgi:hypothetical protein